mmetsp:Transcript_7917/g.12697  ORF Transcript_7917/g.12697 Transcript_7917/m.12697 type:complete len:135 (+) Transcript_7917:434-838(+)
MKNQGLLFSRIGFMVAEDLAEYRRTVETQLGGLEVASKRKRGVALPEDIVLPTERYLQYCLKMPKGKVFSSEKFNICLQEHQLSSTTELRRVLWDDLLEKEVLSDNMVEKGPSKAHVLVAYTSTGKVHINLALD